MHFLIVQLTATEATLASESSWTTWEDRKNRNSDAYSNTTEWAAESFAKSYVEEKEHNIEMNDVMINTINEYQNN